ncbi:cytosine/adenosine deaminase-related metal-dependent hydrolase [Diaminobutyricimonas aerilata]|uniref:Cytosine/adenosine deaminase-related metal-dependent hydrolase n=1 Tax=Diaminobutyricimonas aerilata TaxID=1162967 RepID=A0A2M9CNW9_9MICO|nr:amidohydrolase family protein [Diaminobutyricimonas aerilata]PJJ73605.1 cytosine/adenosine deaminase-related metal-dependent hydrolase [Diaminobutyricimonas aerilata]
MNARPANTVSDLVLKTADEEDRRILIRGAYVVTMDPTQPDLPRGDVLIEGSRIAAVGADLGAHGAATDAVVIDAEGAIVAPGLVDTHRHAWEATLRRSIPDVNDLGEYVVSTLSGVAPVLTPDDVYVGTRLAALTALDSGITCMLDFSHNSRTAEHSDRAIAALAETGIRGVHASMGPHFGEWDHQWPADLARLRSTYFASDDQLLTLRIAALATDEIAGPEIAYGPRLAAVARELGVGVSIDAVFGESSSRAVLEWARAGILDARTTLIHSTGLTADAWKAMGEAGVTVALAPTSDAQIGLETAIPAVDEALAAGIRPGLSIDVEVALVSDMFTQMRALLAIQRMRAVNAAYGTTADVQRITARDVLDFATLQGARTNGLDGVTGSITPGKQADLLLIDAEAVNNMPLNDAVGTIVLGTDPRNVSGVFVAGRVRKWDGELVGVDLEELRRSVHASRDGIIARAGAGAEALSVIRGR